MDSQYDFSERHLLRGDSDKQREELMVHYGESIQKFGGERSWWIRRWDDPFFQKIYKILRDEARKRAKELFHMGSFKSYHGFIKMNVVILCVHGKIQIQFDKRNRDTNEGIDLRIRTYCPEELQKHKINCC